MSIIFPRGGYSLWLDDNTVFHTLVWRTAVYYTSGSGSFHHMGSLVQQHLEQTRELHVSEPCLECTYAPSPLLHLTAFFLSPSNHSLEVSSSKNQFWSLLQIPWLATLRPPRVLGILYYTAFCTLVSS